MIFYVNHPVYRWQGQLYVRTLNFIDFADAVVARLPRARLVLPVRACGCAPGAGFTPLQLVNTPVEVPGYAGHWQALGRTLTNMWRLARLARSGGPAVVMGHAPSSMITALSLLLPSSARFVLFVRGDTPRTVLHMYAGSRYGRWPWRLSRAFERRAFTLQHTTRALVFTYGQELARRYARHDPTGAAVHSIAPLIQDDVVALAPVPVPAGGMLRALFVGRLSNEKGVLELVDALALPAAARVHLTIAGEGPLGPAVQARIDEHGIADRVTLRGFVPPAAVAGLLDAHHLLVLPSRTEGVPRVIAEACARGRMTLATDVGGIAAAFSDAVELLPDNRPATLAAALGRLADEPGTLMARGCHAWQRAREFTLSTHADRVADEIAAWC